MLIYTIGKNLVPMPPKVRRIGGTLVDSSEGEHHACLVMVSDLLEGERRVTRITIHICEGITVMATIYRLKDSTLYLCEDCLDELGPIPGQMEGRTLKLLFGLW